MNVVFHKSFHKQAKLLKPAQMRRLKQALLLFESSPTHPDLYNHLLTGEWQGHCSISFGGDWRMHYKLMDEQTALFVACGTHNQLYN
jgi:addiction module RelE/StbE family toxin